MEKDPLVARIMKDVIKPGVQLVDSKKEGQPAWTGIEKVTGRRLKQKFLTGLETILENLKKRKDRLEGNFKPESVELKKKKETKLAILRI
jgi:hypothetical protein